MNHLLRAQAPISDAGWELLDREARERVTPVLAARKLIDFAGPHGWEHSATNVGRVTPLESAFGEGVSGLQRVVLALVEVRADFELSRAELRDADRGADDAELGPLDHAAHALAEAENAAVFNGWPEAITGIVAASPHKPMTLGKEVDGYPTQVAGAVERMLDSGIGGPYALALGPEHHRRVVESTEQGGYPLLDHLAKIVEGPIVRAPGLKGAVALSTRGGDFVLDSGQDLAIGYDSHDAEVVRLYLQESFSFHVATPEAAVALNP
jgi:uncharacterized linocin/CFP29 family protein